MSALPQSRRARCSRAKPKKRKVIASRRASVRRRRAAAREIIGMRCRLLQVEPDAEVLVLAEPVSGQRFTLPIVTPKRDGQLAASYAPLVGHDVWLSVRFP